MTTEEDTMTNLPLLQDLTYREWHAFVNGLYRGVRWGAGQHPYEDETHYWRIGYLCGSGTRYAGLLALYHYFMND